MPHQILSFDNVLNVRDFGGFALGGSIGIADFKSVELGKLFRGAQLSKMNGDDIAKFKNLGINLIVDLRYLPERKRQATPLTQTFSPQILAYMPDLDQSDSDALAPHETFAIRDLHTANDARKYMLKSYEKRPLDPGFVELCARSLKHMADSGDNVYVHCAAGKDRTGTYCAILLMLLGVHVDDVMAEYMRTEDAVDLDLIINMITRKMSERYGRTYSPDALRPYFGVAPEYLEKSLQKIGDIKTYASSVLELSPARIEKLRYQYTF